MSAGATKIRDWTPTALKPRARGLTQNPKLDRGGQAIRAQILLRLADCPRPGYRALAAELGLSHQAVAAHVERLVAEGLLTRPPGGRPVPTPAGRTVAIYLAAHGRGESLFRRLVRQHWGRYLRAAVYAVRLEAADMDRDWAESLDGLRRVDGELVRKAPAMAILRALRRHTTWAAAAAEVGLQAGALDQRVRTIFSRARRRMR